MKKLILSFLILTGTMTGALAQMYNVTFQVDMRTLAVSANGVHAAGNFQAAAGFAGDWDPATTELTDGDGDGIYAITVQLPAGNYEYKFVNGNAWGADENSIPAACNVNGNRGVTISADIVLPAVAFLSCDPNPAGNIVLLQCDMHNLTVDPAGLSVAGSFQTAIGGANDWTPGVNFLTDANADQIYEIWFAMPDTGMFEYKFVNGSNWEGFSGTCLLGNGNRGMHVTSGTLKPDVVCFNSCTMCPTSAPDTVVVLLQVDMSNQDYPYAPYISTIEDSVSVAGSFQGAMNIPGTGNWSPGKTLLTDPDGDKVYTAYLRMGEGTYAYKFLNGTYWGVDESVPAACNVGGNREMVAMGNNGDTITIAQVCFGECMANCAPALPPINVTFRVDLSNEPAAPMGPYTSGSHQRPTQWDKTKDLMTEITPGSGQYQFTQLIKPAQYVFKYFYGDTTGTGNLDAIGEFASMTTPPAGGCTVSNGLGGFNRTLDLTGVTQDTVLPMVEWNSCTITDPGYSVSIEEYLNALKSFSIVPNPMTEVAEIRFSNKDQANFNMTIVNLTGQVVMRRDNVRGNSIEINRNDLGNGIYFITLWNESGERATRKLIIE